MIEFLANWAVTAWVAIVAVIGAIGLAIEWLI